MAPILVFYHALFCLGNPPELLPQAIEIVCEQMAGLKQSGLEDAASEICIGVNGDPDSAAFSELLPQNALVVYHGLQCKSENRTIQLIEERVKKLEREAYVCYFHVKGASFPPGDSFRSRWRNRMFRCVVLGWRDCVEALDNGADACGCHYLRPENYPGLVEFEYFGGNFFWSKASFLKTLPPIAESPAVKQHGIDAFESRYESEGWIGRGSRRPKVMDFSPGWPA